MGVAVPGPVAGATEALRPDRAGIASAVDTTLALALTAGRGGLPPHRDGMALQPKLRGVDEHRHVSSGSPFEPKIGFSRAVRAGERVCVSGTGPIWDDGSFDDDAGAQARRCLEIIVAALEGLGTSADDVVRTRIYLTDAADIDAVGPVHAEFFGTARPAATAVVVSGLLDPRWKVEIEAEAMLGPGA